VFTVAVIVCRPTQTEAEDFWRYATEAADWEAVDSLLAMRRLTGTPEELARRRREFPQGNGGIPIVGDPDYVAEYLAQISAAGFDGCALSLLNYADELPYFAQEVLPRLQARGLREAA
jgi:alkanesulfonate monooxygenase SsuD/methylene tetrahydromethanopterin reductase-like flavin-dependent oxidoreductase (luciferase family)